MTNDLSGLIGLVQSVETGLLVQSLVTGAIFALLVFIVYRMNNPVLLFLFVLSSISVIAGDSPSGADVHVWTRQSDNIKKADVLNVTWEAAGVARFPAGIPHVIFDVKNGAGNSLNSSCHWEDNDYIYHYWAPSDFQYGIDITYWGGLTQWNGWKPATVTGNGKSGTVSTSAELPAWKDEVLMDMMWNQQATQTFPWPCTFHIIFPDESVLKTYKLTINAMNGTPYLLSVSANMQGTKWLKVNPASSKFQSRIGSQTFTVTTFDQLPNPLLILYEGNVEKTRVTVTWVQDSPTQLHASYNFVQYDGTAWADIDRANGVLPDGRAGDASSGTQPTQNPDGSFSNAPSYLLAPNLLPPTWTNQPPVPPIDPLLDPNAKITKKTEIEKQPDGTFKTNEMTIIQNGSNGGLSEEEMFSAMKAALAAADPASGVSGPSSTLQTGPALEAHTSDMTEVDGIRAKAGIASNSLATARGFFDHWEFVPHLPNIGKTPVITIELPEMCGAAYSGTINVSEYETLTVARLIELCAVLGLGFIQAVKIIRSAIA